MDSCPRQTGSVSINCTATIDNPQTCYQWHWRLARWDRARGGAFYYGNSRGQSLGGSEEVTAKVCLVCVCVCVCMCVCVCVCVHSILFPYMYKKQMSPSQYQISLYSTHHVHVHVHVHVHTVTTWLDQRLYFIMMYEWHIDQHVRVCLYLIVGM